MNSLAGIGSWSACKHYNKDLSKNRKASQPWLPPQESYAFLAPSVFSHISEFLPWIKMNSRDVSTVVFYVLSFYGSKMILDRPNDFGQVPIVMDMSNLFWSAPNHFGQVQIIKISPEKSNLNLTKTICTRPKSFWTYGRTRH